MANHVSGVMQIDMVHEVAVFRINHPKFGEQYVVRQFGEWGQLGDTVWDAEPTDDEIRFVYGDIHIHRGHTAAPKKVMDMVADYLRKEYGDKDG